MVRGPNFHRPRTLCGIHGGGSGVPVGQGGSLGSLGTPGQGGCLTCLAGLPGHPFLTRAWSCASQSAPGTSTSPFPLFPEHLPTCPPPQSHLLHV